MSGYIGTSIDLEKPSLEDIQHFGVLGMRWGKRKGRSSGKSKSFKKKRAAYIKKGLGKDLLALGKMVGKDIAKGMKQDIRTVSKQSKIVGKKVTKKVLRGIGAAAISTVVISGSMAVGKAVAKKVYS